MIHYTLPKQDRLVKAAFLLAIMKQTDGTQTEHLREVRSVVPFDHKEEYTVRTLAQVYQTEVPRQ